jgi:tetratricopeptide (TPR) repeat protein
MGNRGVAAIAVVMAFVVGNQAFAGGNNFRVVYADVPGVEQLESGNVERGIEILEEQLKTTDEESSSDIWATLCATYIIELSLDKAEPACNKAVATGPTYAALNNRGVLRAYQGDYSGAHDDFDRARPLQLEAYLAELMSKDVRVVAADNYRLINIVLARSGAGENDAALARSTAEIEDPNH